MEIIPAILPKNFADLQDGLERLRGVSSWVQIDVVSDIFKEQEGLPNWEDFDFELDLFVEPADFVSRAIELGAARIVVHVRFTSARDALEKMQEFRSGDFPIEVGIALRPTDEPQVLEAFAGLYDYVQVMGIDREGHQGQPFDVRAVGLVSALRALYPRTPLQVDGHAAGHERELAEAGADRLVIGSALMDAPDPKAAYKELYTLIND